jgi:hypothetical protein
MLPNGATLMIIELQYTLFSTIALDKEIPHGQQYPLAA